MKWIDIDSETPNHNEIVLGRTEDDSFVVVEYNAHQNSFDVDFSAIKVDGNGYDNFATISICGKIVKWVRIS